MLRSRRAFTGFLLLWSCTPAGRVLATTAPRSGVEIDRTIHRRNPFLASEIADREGRAKSSREPDRVRYFVTREVLNPDGSFPFGEGFLYASGEPTSRSGDWRAGTGRPAAFAVAGHRGTKDKQQDAFDARSVRVGSVDGAVLLVADGVSASGPLASRASKMAVRFLMQELTGSLAAAPADEAKRHLFVERSIVAAAFVANFEVVRQVLLDFGGARGFDLEDRNLLRRQAGPDLPFGPLTFGEMQRAWRALGTIFASVDSRRRSAMTTVALAVVVDNDLYTFASGDSVVSLFRPSRPKSKRLIHLTERHQAVVEIYKDGRDYRAELHTFSNVITKSFGFSATLLGELRRYPDLLEPGDRILASTDGLGIRAKGRGLHRVDIGEILARGTASDAATALVAAQRDDLASGEYQDNIGVVVLEVQ